MIKIETHLHTGRTSYCAITEPQLIADLYKKAGFGALIVTDHYTQSFFDKFKGEELKVGVDNLLRGYRILKRSGEEIGVKVWLGIEVNLEAYSKDNMPSVEYLLYGERVEELLYSVPELNKKKQQELFELANEYNLIMIQAHPFREYCERGDAKLMHGVEIYNANPRHENHNGLAKEFARKNSLLMTSGGDFHRVGDEGRGGVIMDKCDSIGEFVEAIRAGEAELIR